MSHPIIKQVQIGPCRLILGDCLRVIPMLELRGIKFDRVLTDPPYGIENIIERYGRKRGISGNILNDQTLDVCHAAIALCADRMDDGYIASFYSPRVATDFLCGIQAINEQAVQDAKMAGGTQFLTHVGQILWDKKAPGLGGGGLRYQHENLEIYSVGDPAPLGPCFSVIRAYRDEAVTILVVVDGKKEQKKHPHQKPVGLMRQLLEVMGGESVIDPFMGSGSTAVACAKLGRSFTGIELDPDFFELACRRVQDAVNQPDMFAQAIPSEQEALL